MNTLNYSQIEKIESCCGKGFLPLLEEVLINYFTAERLHTLPRLADKIYQMLQHLEKKAGKYLTIVNFSYMWLAVKNAWVMTSLNNLDIDLFFTFESVVNLIKEYELKLNILSQTTEFIEDISDDAGFPIDSKTFHRANIVNDIINCQLYDSIPINEAALKLIIENETGDELLIRRFVDFCKFIIEYDSLEFGDSNRMESIINMIARTFKLHFIVETENPGKFHERINMWKNLTKLGTFLGPLIKERLRVVGLLEIYSDASILLTLLKGLERSRKEYEEDYTRWKIAYELRYKEKPKKIEYDPLHSATTEEPLLLDDFGINFLNINEVQFDPDNFESIFNTIKCLDENQKDLDDTYISKLLNQLRKKFITSIEKDSSITTYYGILVAFLMKSYENYKKSAREKHYVVETLMNNDYCGYFVANYCPNHELFYKKYWLPRLIKTISRPPEDDISSFMFRRFDNSFSYYCSKRLIEEKEKLLTSMDEATENTKTLENGCRFTNYLISKDLVDIEVVDADTVWADNILKKEWEGVVGKLTETSKLLENNNAVHYVTIETPLKLVNGSYLSVQTSMCSAAILNCFNDKDVMTLDNFIKELKVTKSQSKRLFSCLNKLIGSKLLLKGKDGICFNYDFDCSKITSNPLKV